MLDIVVALSLHTASTRLMLIQHSDIIDCAVASFDDIDHIHTRQT